MEGAMYAGKEKLQQLVEKKHLYFNLEHEALHLPSLWSFLRTVTLGSLASNAPSSAKHIKESGITLL